MYIMNIFMMHYTLRLQVKCYTLHLLIIIEIKLYKNYFKTLLHDMKLE